jgi:hypothetical protein
MIKGLILFVVFCSVCAASRAAVVYDTVYINKGQFTTIDTTYFAYYTFNDSDNFNKTNSRLQLGLNDSLYLLIINTDIDTHGFNVTNTLGYNATIPPGDSAIVAMQFSQMGVYIFYDEFNYPNYMYMGAGAMLIVDDFSGARFFWNIKDHQAEWNDTLDNGYIVDWTQYYPNYFTVNGLSNPFINDDVAARVTGNVGDTIRIYITNTGQGIHSLHFHGYHLKIIYSSESTAHTGREKDTFPIKSMESMILELVPDKPGEYPVHDHNLVAVTGGNIYPNGMFLTMLIP